MKLNSFISFMCLNNSCFNNSCVSKCLNKSIEYIKQRSLEYKIDDSHNYKHSIAVFKEGRKLMDMKSKNFPSDNRMIVYLGCLLHDMCDRKYIDEKKGLEDIEQFLTFDCKLDKKIISAVTTIIPKMSYSKTIKNNSFVLPSDLIDFPYLDEYHLIRHADLLTAYDLLRPIDLRYGVEPKLRMNMEDIVTEADNIIKNRVLTMIDGNIFIDRESKQLAQIYHEKALKQYNQWKKSGSMDYEEIKRMLS